MKRYLSMTLVLCALSGPLSTSEAGVVKNRALQDLSGRKVRLWKKNATVAVFLFFKAKHRYTEHAFKELARCKDDIGKRPVTFVGIISASEPKAEITRMLARLKVTIPVLVDPDRKLATELRIKAFPTFALINVKRSKVFKQPIMRIGLCEALVARVKFALGEIDQRQMDSDSGGGEGITKKSDHKALRLQRVASMLRKQGRHKEAQDAIHRSIKQDPRCARSHAVLGSILVDIKKCKEASRAFAAALKLDKNDSLALAGKKRTCGK